MAAALALSLLATNARAFAQAPPPAERAHVYSAYELETIDRVMTSLHAKIDPEPEGKIV